MRVVDRGDVSSSLEIAFVQAMLNCIAVQQRLGSISKVLAGIILSQHFQDHLPLMPQHRAMSGDDHAVLQFRRTSGQRLWHAVNFNETQTAAANRFEPVVMTQCGNIDSDGPTRVQD